MILPFFSIIIPLYNREITINKTLNSVLKQVFLDFEVIVIDDCSVDDSYKIACKFQVLDSRVKVLRNEINQERCVSRNKGILNSKGKYICFLDSDDEFLPNHLENLYNSIKSSEEKKALFFTNAFQTYNFENLQERYTPDLNNYNLFEYILTYTFNPARVVIHRSILDELQFDEKIPGIEDLDLWLRIATLYPVIQIQKRTVIYNIHDESYTVSKPNRYKQELSFFRYVFSKQILKDFLPIQSKRRLLSMCHYKISMAMSNSFSPFIVHYHILKAFSLYPKGYNSNANKTMLVIFLDQIPILGFGFKYLRKILKK